MSSDPGSQTNNNEKTITEMWSTATGTMYSHTSGTNNPITNGTRSTSMGPSAGQLWQSLDAAMTNGATSATARASRASPWYVQNAAQVSAQWSATQCIANPYGSGAAMMLSKNAVACRTLKGVWPHSMQIASCAVSFILSAMIPRPQRRRCTGPAPKHACMSRGPIVTHGVGRPALWHTHRKISSASTVLWPYAKRHSANFNTNTTFSTSGSKGFPQYIWATSPSVRVELGPSGRFRRWAMACSFVVGDSQCDPEALSSRCMSSPSEGMGPRLQSTQKASRMLDHTREQRPDERGLVGHRASTSAITRLHC
mmetsp:Transcript_3787/g.6099  ORF Transcript_3787/g.6099 Transcript_3787/m.6099 type:complete len:311 (-) Transcript_3787:75-1007(-)